MIGNMNPQKCRHKSPFMMSIGKGNCWQLRMTVNHVPHWFDSSLPSMEEEKKEKPKLPEGTHVSETDAKNRKVIRELKGKKNNK